jgi:hypothetical protein
MPGNAGRGKGPQFKAGDQRGEVLEIGATLANSVKAREPLTTPHAEVKEGLGRKSEKQMPTQVVASAVVLVWPRATKPRDTRNAADRLRRARPFVGEGMRLVREPDAGNLHVRFDEGDVETELRRGYWGTVRRKGRQQTHLT